MSSHDINPIWKLVSIGRGSFATVSILSGRPVAFKQVISLQQTLDLKLEFETHHKIYGSCNADPFFAIPRPLAYFDPAVSASYVSLASSSVLSGRRLRGPCPIVSEADFRALQLDSAAYAMDQVLPLPLSTALIIRQLFYPPGQESATLPSLCRLYFGKVIDKKPRSSLAPPIRFFNSANFPLDVVRYCRTVEASNNPDDYPTVDDIAYGMGESLGRLHWIGGYDGRDVEFIMGGAAFSVIAMNLIDFNQMRSWSRKEDDALSQIVQAFFTNDPYYPRPRPGDPIYQKFCLGYLKTLPDGDQKAADFAKAFLYAIEAEQSNRDSFI